MLANIQFKTEKFVYHVCCLRLNKMLCLLVTTDHTDIVIMVFSQCFASFDVINDNNIQATISAV